MAEYTEQYTPVFISSLTKTISINSDDVFLLAKGNNGMTSYTSYKLLFNTLSTKIYNDIIKQVPDLSSIIIKRSQLNDSKEGSLSVVGSEVIKLIDNDVTYLSGNMVGVTDDQQISGKKQFIQTPTIIETATEANDAVNKSSMEKYVEQELNAFYPFFYNNNIRRLVHIKGSSSKTLDKSSNSKYTASNDCMLYINVTSDKGAAGLQVRINDYTVQVIPDNDNEGLWAHTISLPVKKGTVVTLSTTTPKLWYISEIQEFSVT